jgi:hypothetical protein
LIINFDFDTMPPRIDAAIVKALSLDPSSTIANHGSSGFATTSKITSNIDDQERIFFVKTGKGSDSQIMFTGRVFHHPLQIPFSLQQPKERRHT